MAEGRHINQQTGIGNPETEPHKYAQLTFDKGVKGNWMEEGWSFQQRALKQLDIHSQTNEPSLSITPHAKLTQYGS